MPGHYPAALRPQFKFVTFLWKDRRRPASQAQLRFSVSVKPEESISRFARLLDVDPDRPPGGIFTLLEFAKSDRLLGFPVVDQHPRLSKGLLIGQGD